MQFELVISNTDISDTVPYEKKLFNDEVIEQTIEPELTENQYTPIGPIIGILGKGGMATVYAALNEKLRVIRALKVLNPDANTLFRRLFENEISVMTQLDHPNIITIHNIGTWGNLPYIEMNYIDGWSLDAFIKDHYPLPPEICVAVGCLICDALDYAHHKVVTMKGKSSIGIIHRDLKPSNILISKEGRVVLIDFGVSFPKDTNPCLGDNKIIGSLQYAAPELLSNNCATNQCDIFSFGCVLYEMVVGKKAFNENTVSELVNRRLNNSFSAIPISENKVINSLKPVIEKCLQKSPEKRYKDIRQIRNILKNILALHSGDSPEQLVINYVCFGSIPLPSSSKKQKDIRTILFNLFILSILPLTVLLKSQNPENIDGIGAYYSSMYHQKHYPHPVENVPFTQEPQNLAIAADYNQIDKNAVPVKESNASVRDNTADIIGAIKSEYNKNNFLEVIRLYNGLDSVKARSSIAVLYNTKALKELKKLSLEYFQRIYIFEAEFLMIRAQIEFAFDRFSVAINSLLKSKSAPALLIDPITLQDKTDSLLVYYRMKKEEYLRLRVKHNYL